MMYARCHGPQFHHKVAALARVSTLWDGRLLASSSRDHDARLWDVRTLTLVKVLHRHTAFVSGVAFSSDSRWVATAIGAGR